MDGSDRAPWFLGDLDDPWVVAIADAVRRARRFHLPGDLPDDWPAEGEPPSAVILHRSCLTVVDAHRVARLRSIWESPPRTVLCVGPQARFADVESWSKLVEVVIPEATAPETVARHASGVVPGPRAPGSRPRVVVVSGNHELRAVLAEACGLGGYPAEVGADLDELAPGGPVVWDVPVLEEGWTSRLARRAQTSKVVALLGFADRATVAAARASGASACLELPFEPADLISSLDRLTVSHRSDPAHGVPPKRRGDLNRQGAKVGRRKRG